MNELLTSAEVKKALKISHNTLLKLIKQGLPYLKLGRDYRFPRREIEEWIQKKTTSKR
jgi:excisionase family DNA binding protein